MEGRARGGEEVRGVVSVLLRPYQERGIEALRVHVRAGRRRVILCLATGGGKTMCAADIVRSARTHFDARVLFIAHRLELIDQAVKQLARFGVTSVGVMRADDERTNPAAPVQVATIQTLSRRNPPKADIVFIDECHRAAANSYRRVIATYPEATIIGLTATPCRPDSKPLGDVFEAIETAATYSELIADKFIVRPRCFGVPPGARPNIDKVHTKMGDFVLDELESEMMRSDVVGDVLAEYQKHAQGRRTVVFAVTVAHSRSILDRFLAAGVRAAHVDAETPLDERRMVSEKLRSGDIEVVTSVGIYLEGWDEPCAKCAILARPTKSLVLFMQSCGRILRPWHPSTPRDRSWQPEDGESVTPILIDCGGNIARFGRPDEDRTWSLDSAPLPSARKQSTCIKCHAYLSRYPCSECGYAPEVEQRKVTEDRSKELVEVDVRQSRAFDANYQFFKSLVETCRQRGYKPAFAKFRYKEQKGELPPWSWTYECEEMFKNDPIWRTRVSHRQSQREAEREREIAQYPTDAEFSDWLRRDS
jgi:DNA repair protein RadD